MNKRYSLAMPFLLLAALLVAPTAISIYRATNGGPLWPCLLGGFAVLSNVAFAIRALRRDRIAADNGP